MTVIRPLMYVPEADVIGFRNLMQLPVCKSPCPADGYTKRQYAKDLLKQLNEDHPGTTDRMFSAVINGTIPGWPQKGGGRL